MNKTKKLSKKQLAVLDDIFSGEMDEQDVLDKHKVSRNQYYKWLADECFAEEFDRYIAIQYKQSTAFIARYATLASSKLVQLTDSESQETARKACLDILSFSDRTPNPRFKTSEPTSQTPASPLSPQTASRLLAVLAEEKGDG